MFSPSLKSVFGRAGLPIALSLALLGSNSLAVASDYYLVVSSPGRVTSRNPDAHVPAIRLALSPFNMPAGSVFEPYRHDFNAMLQVEGDSAFDATQVQWRTTGGQELPSGLSLSSAGILVGTPLQATDPGAYIEVEAQYKGERAAQQYAIQIRHKDPHWAWVTALLGFDGVPGSIAYSEPVKPPTFIHLAGQAQLVADHKFGTSSLSIANGHAELPGSLFAFGLRPFTYEAYIKLRTDVSGSFAVLETRPPSTNGPYITWTVTTTGMALFHVNSMTRIQTTVGTVPNNGQWQHLAYSRDSNRMGRLFINGVMAGSWVDDTDYQAGASAMIGKNADRKSVV